MSGGATSDPEPKKPDRICAWCSARAEAGQVHCSQCGAELAQRETIDGLTIAGVTDVDPALVEPETHRTIVTLWSERAGSVTIIGSQPETTSRPCDPATLGEPSEAARRVVQRLDGSKPRRDRTRHPRNTTDSTQAAWAGLWRDRDLRGRR